MAASIPGDSASVDKFIAKWLGQEGGQERANYALFLTEFCDALGLDHPEPASAAHAVNDYVFERVVQETGRDGAVSNRRIDLYKRNSFVLEAKQSRLKGGEKEVPGQTDLFVTEAAPRGRRRAGVGRAHAQCPPSGGGLCAPPARRARSAALRPCLRCRPLFRGLRQFPA